MRKTAQHFLPNCFITKMEGAKNVLKQEHRHMIALWALANSWITGFSPMRMSRNAACRAAMGYGEVMFRHCRAPNLGLQQEWAGNVVSRRQLLGIFYWEVCSYRLCSIRFHFSLLSGWNFCFACSLLLFYLIPTSLRLHSEISSITLKGGEAIWEISYLSKLYVV